LTEKILITFIEFKKQLNMAEDKKRTVISMDVKDSFFDDPFFKDWWNDFDAPMQDKTFQRQISGNEMREIYSINNVLYHLSYMCHKSKFGLYV